MQTVCIIFTWEVSFNSGSAVQLWQKDIVFLFLPYDANMVLSSRYHEMYAYPKASIWDSYSLACDYHKQQSNCWLHVHKVAHCKMGYEGTWRRAFAIALALSVIHQSPNLIFRFYQRHLWLLRCLGLNHISPEERWAGVFWPILL